MLLWMRTVLTKHFSPPTHTYMIHDLYETLYISVSSEHTHDILNKDRYLQRSSPPPHTHDSWLSCDSLYNSVFWTDMGMDWRIWVADFGLLTCLLLIEDCIFFHKLWVVDFGFQVADCWKEKFKDKFIEKFREKFICPKTAGMSFALGPWSQEHFLLLSWPFILPCQNRADFT